MTENYAQILAASDRGIVAAATHNAGAARRRVAELEHEMSGLRTALSESEQELIEAEKAADAIQAAHASLHGRFHQDGNTPAEDVARVCEEYVRAEDALDPTGDRFDSEDYSLSWAVGKLVAESVKHEASLVSCPSCQGTGSDSPSGKYACRDCEGNGKVPSTFACALEREKLYRAFAERMAQAIDDARKLHAAEFAHRYYEGEPLEQCLHKFMPGMVYHCWKLRTRSVYCDEHAEDHRSLEPAIPASEEVRQPGLEDNHDADIVRSFTALGASLDGLAHIERLLVKSSHTKEDT